MPDEGSQSTAGMIITDDVTFNPILDFEAYSNTIVKMITQSHPKFSIGIYGEWVTGKTTLMKVIEDKLNSIAKEDIFIWEDLLQNKKESNNRLATFLKDNHKADWIHNSQFTTENDTTLSLYDTNKSRIVDDKGSYRTRASIR